MESTGSGYGQPLAARIRPAKLEEFAGQEHLTGPGKPLNVAIAARHHFSFILWGPPGVGKTTLARIYANALDGQLHELSAVSAGKDDIRQVITAAKAAGRPTLLFLDEIHRFNKAQQDFLLPHVETGQLTLIGATTENPSFEVIPALLSRCRVFVLNGLDDAAMNSIIDRTGLVVEPAAREWLVNMANGDARQLLGVLDATEQLYRDITVDRLSQAFQNKFLRYDKKGEEHYNVISAFIKSMRAGSADAAVYYLARMLEAGEDPKFIARRMVIFASEDVGLAQPTALVFANEVFRAVETIGLPECAISLSHGAAYLARCAKDRSAYDALNAAQGDVKEFGNAPVPMKLRNAPTRLMKELGYGAGYEQYVKENLLPDKLKNRKYFKEPEKPRGK